MFVITAASQVLEKFSNAVRHGKQLGILHRVNFLFFARVLPFSLPTYLPGSTSPVNVVNHLGFTNSWSLDIPVFVEQHQISH